jgi:hypothetical protein
MQNAATRSGEVGVLFSSIGTVKDGWPLAITGSVGYIAG